MSVSDKDQAFLREVQKKFDKKVRENEISVLEYWKERLDKIAAMRPEGIASLQLEIKKVSSMMANRVRTLKEIKE
ncbi:MAG: hypothetical protein ABFD62_14055 [Syntrophaceae bacterium]